MILMKNSMSFAIYLCVYIFKQANGIFQWIVCGVQVSKLRSILFLLKRKCLIYLCNGALWFELYTHYFELGCADGKHEWKKV